MDRILPTYLKEQNFRISKSEFFNGFPCYVLEAKQPDQQEGSFERIWVSPELGLRYLQYESRFFKCDRFRRRTNQERHTHC